MGKKNKTLTPNQNPLLVYPTDVLEREKKQALAGDPESERRAFAFRLGEWEVRWVIRGAAFCEGMPSEDSEGSKKVVIQ